MQFFISFIIWSLIQIATKKDLPYFEIVEHSNGTFYRGFVVDLIEAIFKQIKNETNIELEYEFYKVADNKLGNPIPESKKWDGIIGDLIEHVSDDKFYQRLLHKTNKNNQKS